MHHLQNPYNLFLLVWEKKLKIMYIELLSISFSNGTAKNIGHLKKVITLFPIVYHIKKFYFPLFLLCYIISFPLVLLVRLIRPIIHIKFGKLLAHGFGQCILVAEVYLSRKVAGFDDKHTLDLFFYQGEMQNFHLDKVIKRKMHVNLFIEPFYVVNAFIPGWEKHIVKSPSYYPETDVEHSFLKVPPQLTFNNDEMSRAKVELKKMGMSPDVKFVCLYIRDSGYLINPLTLQDSSDVNQYAYLIDKLVDEGYYVVRMGKNVSIPLNYIHPNVIDYGSNFHSDLMDIWLTAHCHFLINSIGGGLSAASVVYRRPLFCINYNLDFWSTAKDSLVSFQKYKRGGKYLTLSEIIDLEPRKLSRNNNLNQSDIQIENQSESEVLKMLDEMISRLNGTWESNPETIEMQNKLWSILKTWKGYHAWHGDKMLCHIGQDYLLKNKDWLLN